MNDRLAQQIAFLNEIERLKVVYRRNGTVDRSRAESSAEHSWHVALMALILAEHASIAPLDVAKVVRMLLIHDLVEVYAGDTWLYAADPSEQRAREEQSARTLFALLPADQETEFRALWQEYESRSSPEAAYAAAIDGLQPLCNHLATGEPGDIDSHPTDSDVLVRKAHISNVSETLWGLAQEIIVESTYKGLYVRGPGASRPAD